jgi:hypothetical protein
LIDETIKDKYVQIALLLKKLNLMSFHQVFVLTTNLVHCDHCDSKLTIAERLIYDDELVSALKLNYRLNGCYAVGKINNTNPTENKTIKKLNEQISGDLSLLTKNQINRINKKLNKYLYPVNISHTKELIYIDNPLFDLNE